MGPVRRRRLRRGATLDFEAVVSDRSGMTLASTGDERRRASDLPGSLPTFWSPNVLELPILKRFGDISTDRRTISRAAHPVQNFPAGGNVPKRVVECSASSGGRSCVGGHRQLVTMVTSKASGRGVKRQWGNRNGRPALPCATSGDEGVERSVGPPAATRAQSGTACGWPLA